MNDESKRRFFSGDTLQQALVQAANYFNLDPGEIAYRAIEKRHGFIKVRRKVVIEVDPEAPRRTEPAPAPAVPAVPAAPAVPAGLATPAPGPGAPAARPGFDEARVEAPPPAAPRRERRPGPPGRSGDRRGGERGRDRDRRPRGERGDRGRGDRGGDRGVRAGGGPRGPRDPREIDAQPRMPMLDRAERQRPLYETTENGGLVRLPEKPRRPSERYPAATGPQAAAAAKGMDLLLRISGLDLEARVLQGEERLEVDLAGEDADWCFADEGELLAAFEHLLPRVIRSLSGEALIVRVDCDNFHEIREERLRSLAQRMADEVRRLGRPRVLEPMNPADRRIVHLTLSDDPGVVTESEGDGYFKRITIRPV
jgi:spoIIIJ-associated protein